MTTHHSLPISHVTPLILAGGQSRRMGTDKRLLEIDGEPLVLRAVRVASEIGEPRVLVRDAADRARLAAALPTATRFLLDPRPGAGPLCALAGALAQIEPGWALVLAADLPFVDAGLLSGLVGVAHNAADGAGHQTDAPQPVVIVPHCNQLQVTCAVYATDGGPELEDACAARQRSLTRWVAELPGGRVQIVPPTAWRRWVQLEAQNPFHNVNTEVDAMAAGIPPGPAGS